MQDEPTDPRFSMVASFWPLYLMPTPEGCCLLGNYPSPPAGWQAFPEQTNAQGSLFVNPAVSDGL